MTSSQQNTSSAHNDTNSVS